MESLEKIGKVFIVRGCVQGSGFRSNHRNCFKRSRKMAIKSEKYVSKKRWHSPLLWSLIALFRAQSIPVIIQKQDKGPESQK